MKPEWVWRIIPLVIAGFIGYFSGQISAESRMTRLETIVEERFDRMREGHDHIRADLEGIRAEIMGILKERR